MGVRGRVKFATKPISIIGKLSFVLQCPGLEILLLPSVQGTVHIKIGDQCVPRI